MISLVFSKFFFKSTGNMLKHYDKVSNNYILIVPFLMDTFGKQRLTDFYLDPTSININHGSFGLCPKVVIDAKKKHE